jgi:hypothetical protein
MFWQELIGVYILFLSPCFSALGYHQNGDLLSGSQNDIPNSFEERMDFLSFRNVLVLLKLQSMPNFNPKYQLKMLNLLHLPIVL